ncbi:hypothetical protein F5X99DRAFT_234224 [Biscogniauxia marginata]|nr:hypothetical protein F5X99DRAFT_234224 [Biscogniauxia marginata]
MTTTTTIITSTPTILSASSPPLPSSSISPHKENNDNNNYGIETELVYFSRDEKFLHEKPYTTAFAVDHIPGARVDNHEFERSVVRVRPLSRCHQRRNRLSDHVDDDDDGGEKLSRNYEMTKGLEPRLDTHGFTFVRAETALERADFDDPSIVATRYYAELAALLKREFPHYRKVAFFDNVVRKRVPLYPSAKGAPATAAQPFRYAHVDFTAHGATLKLENALGEDLLRQRLEMKCDVINIWRLLNDRPTRDWPLAFCDWRTVDPADDLIANDVVYQRGLGESCFLQRNPGHHWWYLPDQQPDEVAVFRNVRVDDENFARGFHCAFFNPLATPEDAMRESIEVRLAAFY